MKRLFTILYLVLVFASVNAQRKTDLQITTLTPGKDNIIKNGQPFDISVNLKNLGTDATKSTDTLIFFPLIDNNYIMSGGVPLSKGFTGSALALPVNGSVNINNMWTGLAFNGLTLDGQHDFCVGVVITNRSADSCRDMNTTNNTSCNKVWMDKFPVGLAQVTANTVVFNSLNVSPNPATESVNIDYTVADASDVTISVKDLQGREVIHVTSEKKAMGIYSESVNVASLSTGIYLVEYITGDKVFTQKLIKK